MDARMSIEQMLQGMLVRVMEKNLLDLRGKQVFPNRGKAPKERKEDCKMDARMRIWQLLQGMLELEKRENLFALLDGIKSGKYRYLLTYDMGCGNTSAAVMDLQYKNGLRPKTMITWKYNDPSKGKITGPSVPTMLGFDVQKPVVGPMALKYGKFVENFKRLPTQANLDELYPQVGQIKNFPRKRIWECFFEETLRLILQNAQTKPDYTRISRDNVILMVGRPSGEEWTSCLGNYRSLIKAGTGLDDAQILTVSEAKASMSYVQWEKKSKSFLVDWKGGVVVIDLGASTIDIMFLGYGKQSREFSISMAGKEVDALLGHERLMTLYPEEMAARGLTDDPLALPEAAFFTTGERKKTLTSKASFSYYMRTMKENICKWGEVSDIVNGRSLVWDIQSLTHLLQTARFPLRCADPAMARDMNGQKEGEAIKLTVMGTWYEHLTRLVSFALRQITEESGIKEVKTVVITGGTANLTGVEDCVKSGILAAGWSPVEPLVLNQPADYEQTVPYGGADYFARVLDDLPHLEAFPAKLTEALKKDLLTAWTPILVDKIAPVVEKPFYAVLDNWGSANTTGDESRPSALRKSVRDIKLDNAELHQAIAQAVAKMKTQSAVEWTATMTAIQELLNALSVSSKYEQPISVGTIRIDLNTDTLKNAIGASLNNLPFNNFLNNYKKGIIYFWRNFFNDDAVVPLHVKTQMVADIKQNSMIRPYLYSPIAGELEHELDESECLGLPGQIIQGLSRNINEAMFIG